MLQMKRPKLSFYNNLHLEIYAKCIRPMDNTIDWQSYFDWAQIKGLPNPEESADYILFIRDEIHNKSDKIKTTKPENLKLSDEKTLSPFEKKLADKKLKDVKDGNTILPKIKNKKEIDEMLKKSGKFA